jgi:hypothetical protein
MPGATVWEVDGAHDAAVTVAHRWVPTLLDALASVVGLGVVPDA